MSAHGSEVTKRPSDASAAIVRCVGPMLRTKETMCKCGTFFTQLVTRHDRVGLCCNSRTRRRHT